MKWFVAMTLVLTLLVVGMVGWLLYIGNSPNLPPLPPKPPDKPILVVESMDPALDPPPLVSLPDLSKVDRSLIEPKGLVKPRYCLLVFGPQAKTRVWIVEDGKKLYVDRNANGDLTDDGEACTPTERRESKRIGEDGKEVPYREWTYLPGDLTPDDQSGKHTGLKLVCWQEGTEPVHYEVSIWVGGVTLQYAGWGPLFADSRDAAVVVHFGGPVLAKPLRGSALRLGGEHQELHFCLGTPGLGSHSFAFVGLETVPSAVRPVAQVAWPTEAGVLKESFVLVRRC
jgi:hypothetical protein